MNDNGFEDGQYGSGYDRNGYDGSGYDGTGYDPQYNNQQYNAGYDNIPPVQLNLPEGIASRIPERWKENIEDALTDAAREAARKENSPYEHVPPRAKNGYANPAFALIGLLILFAGCIPFKMGNSTLFVFCFGSACFFIGLSIIFDKRNHFKRHTKSCVWLIFGIEVMLASGYQMLANSGSSLQPMDGRDIGRAFGIIIGSLAPLLLIFHYLNYRFQKEICSQEVEAVCVYVQSRMKAGNNGHSYQVYIPIYEFPYKGSKACIAGDGVSNSMPVVGMKCNLMINPDDPTDFYYKNEKPKLYVWVLAIAAILLGYLLFNSTFGGGR